MENVWREGCDFDCLCLCYYIVCSFQIDQDEDIGYLKSFALFTWLFGDELQGTLLLAKKDSVKIYCNSGDAAGLLKIVNKKAEKSKHPDVTIIAYKEVRECGERTSASAARQRRSEGDLMKVL